MLRRSTLAAPRQAGVYRVVTPRPRIPCRLMPREHRLRTDDDGLSTKKPAHGANVIAPPQASSMLFHRKGGTGQSCRSCDLARSMAFRGRRANSNVSIGTNGPWTPR